MTKQGQRILIVGPGFVGDQLAATLSGKGNPVIAVGRSRAGELSCDVSNPASVRELSSHMKWSPDVVVHCASSGRGGGADAYRAVYFDGVTNLIETFPESWILFTSSSSVYEQRDGSIVTEKSPTARQSPLSRILREAEDIVLKQGGTVLRLSGIYGPGRAIHLQRILEGTAIIEKGKTSRWLNQIHRDDVVSGILHLLAREGDFARGGVFNLSDATPMTQRDCYEQLADFFKVPRPPEAPARPGGKRMTTNKRVSNSKLRGTDWKPRYPSLLDAVKTDPELVDSIRRK